MLKFMHDKFVQPLLNDGFKVFKHPHLSEKQILKGLKLIWTVQRGDWTVKITVTRNQYENGDIYYLCTYTLGGGDFLGICHGMVEDQIVMTGSLLRSEAALKLALLVLEDYDDRLSAQEQYLDFSKLEDAKAWLSV